MLLTNARVVTLDPCRPVAGAVAMRRRIVAVGSPADLHDLCGPTTEILDAEGGLAVPAFHDAHCHLLSWARSRSALDCRGIGSLAELARALGRRSAVTPRSEWIRANGYDETLLGRHPDRRDLDLAAPEHPVRLQHRSLHVDVLSSRALQLTGLVESADPRVERDPETSAPTGRLFSAGDLLHGRLPRPALGSLADDVRRACAQLFAWGVTSVQDASFTNGEEEWDLFHELSEAGQLPIRTFVLLGSGHWRTAHCWRPESQLVRKGPVKLMLDEATTDFGAFAAALHEAHMAGNAVAVHAVSEAEVATALQAFRSAPPGPLPCPRRIEHAAVVPDALLDEMRELKVAVVGQPALIYERGDVYRGEYPGEQHAWLHRARSFVAGRVPYAVGSDAPVTEPNPLVGIASARWRSTKRGAVLGADEKLTKLEALRAFTHGPAEAVAVHHQLGRLAPGLAADIAVLDPDALDADPADAARREVRATIMEGRVVWRRGAP